MVLVCAYWKVAGKLGSRLWVVNILRGVLRPPHTGSRWGMHWPVLAKLFVLGSTDTPSSRLAKHDGE